MCVILSLKPEVLPPFDKIKNAVLNNPDGWGLITVDRGKLALRRELPEKGNDPDVIYDALDQSLDTFRYLHVRHNTVGDTNLENVHPFKVFGSDAREVYFMHNGTLHLWKPNLISDKRSDSLNFAASYLSPLLYHFFGDNHGIGDYTDDFFKKIFMNEFKVGSRGLLVSNDLPPLELGDWKTVKYENTEFRASNDDYFDKINESRVHSGQKGRLPVPAETKVTFQEKVFEERKTTTTQGTSHATQRNNTSRTVTELKKVDLGKLNQEKISPDELKKLCDWINMDDATDEDISYLTWIASSEVVNYAVAFPSSAGWLLKFMFERFSTLYDLYIETMKEKDESETKHDKASMKIEALVLEIEKMKAVMAEYEKGAA